MTLTTLIIVNAVLGAAVTYGIVWLLGFGIQSDRAVRGARVSRLHRRAFDRLAA